MIQHTTRRWAWRASIGVIFAIILTLGARPATAIPIVIQYSDGPGEGFNDPTLGAARKTAFEFAASIWATSLEGNQIVVDAAMDSLGGGGNSAVLGQASSAFVARDFTGAPIPGTWYPIALANTLAGEDLTQGSTEIIATFNSDVDNTIVLGTVDWYYGTDTAAGSDIDFVTVVLHELAHGLGFFDMISSSTGEWLNGFPDIFGRNLERTGVGQFTALTDSERRAALTSGAVDWNGANVVAEHGAPAAVYAPSPYEDGSSISHWDMSLDPDELLEPFYTGPEHGIGLALPAMQDIGWSIFSGGPTTTATSTSTTFAVTTTTTTTLPPIDPFLCYKTKRSKKSAKFARVRDLTLADQFEVTSTVVIKPKELCNPASLGAGAFLDAATHLGGFSITGSPKHVPLKIIRAATQLGSIFVATVKPDRLLVPSATSVVGDPGPLDSEDHEVDHFKCYKVKLLKGSPTPHVGVQVTLTDQFTTAKTFDIKKPKRLCNPVDKNGEGIKNGVGHLLCYGLKAGKRQPKTGKQSGVYLTNELGSIRRDTKKEELLCLGAVITVF